MGDIGSEFVDIRDILSMRHAAYIGRFGKASVRHAGQEVMMTARIMAKIKLMARALEASGAIDEVEELDVKSKNYEFPMSLRLGRRGIQHSVYLLNTGRDIIVANSMEIASALGTIAGRISVVSDETKACKQYRNVLNPEFDWKAFSIGVLDLIHDVIYARHDVIRETLLTNGDTNGHA